VGSATELTRHVGARCGPHRAPTEDARHGRLLARGRRVLVPLLEAGFAVEGLDVSPEMLAVCRQHCRDRGLDPVLRQADMTAVAEPGAYQAIIIPAGSIMLLDGRDEVPRADRPAGMRQPGGPAVLVAFRPALPALYAEWVRMRRSLRELP
jgi:hypothetical protein